MRSITLPSLDYEGGSGSNLGQACVRLLWSSLMREISDRNWLMVTPQWPASGVDPLPPVATGRFAERDPSH